MYRLLRKIVTTPKLVIPKQELLALDLAVLGEKIDASVKKLFAGSLAIREVAAGSSNAEEQELTALGNVYYDVERFGIHFVASPRHADMLFVTGPVSRNMAEGLRHTYEAMPTPRFVVAVGDGAISGGIYRDSYAIHNKERETHNKDTTSDKTNTETADTEKKKKKKNKRNREKKKRKKKNYITRQTLFFHLACGCIYI